MKVVNNFTNEKPKQNESFTICECRSLLVIDKILDKIIENDEEFFKCSVCGKEFVLEE